ncbi:MAG: hypothetical protein R3251_01350 [Candidatus Spechtbacterales bacterium]|nr:hypothetical protein [Candidatus Spechtbacterales bacterium]
MLRKTPKFSRIFFVVYVVVALVLLALPKNILPGFYNIPVMATLALVSAFIIILPRLIFKPKQKVQERGVAKMQNVLTLSLLINGAGGLGLYKLYQYGFEYDKLMHYATPLILTLGFIYFFRNYSNWPLKKALWRTSFLVFAGGIFWEILEWTSDRLLDTSFVLGGGGIGWRDTIFDVIANILGILTAVIYLHYKSRK